MHFQNPVSERVHDELQHMWVRYIERVSASREIDVSAAVLGETVVAGIVDAPHGQHRSRVIAFGRVIVYDIQNDLDSSCVQGAHHLLEFVHGIFGAARAIARLRCKEAERVVAPVILESRIDQSPLIGVVVHRKQFDRRDAKGC